MGLAGTGAREITIPTLLAEPVDDGLRVWCIWCRQHHHHGDGYGHRVAHCANPRSPYRDTGYVLTRPQKVSQ